MDTLLDQLRQEGDPEGDALVQLLALHYADLRPLVDLLTDLVRLGDENVDTLNIPAAVRPDFDVFLQTESQLPGWSNSMHLHDGALHFRNHTMFAYVVLGCASLPNCYSWEGEAAVLGETGRLIEHVHRRIPETAQFVHDVMVRDGLNVSAGYMGRGIESARKVRLMHAIMRHLIKADPSSLDIVNPSSLGEFLVLLDWDSAEHGEPINQEHMVGTLLTFSYVVLHEMLRFGFVVANSERDAFLHTWNVVGTLLGVREDVIQQYLSTYSDCERMFRVIRRRNLAATSSGTALTSALIGYFRSRVTPPLGFAPRILTRLLTGQPVSRVVGVTYGFRYLLLVPVVIVALHFFAWLKRLRWTQRLSNWFFAWLTDKIWQQRSLFET